MDVHGLCFLPGPAQVSIVNALITVDATRPAVTYDDSIYQIP